MKLFGQEGLGGEELTTLIYWGRLLYYGNPYDDDLRNCFRYSEWLERLHLMGLGKDRGVTYAA